MQCDEILKQLEKKIKDKEAALNPDSILSWLKGEQKYKKKI